MLKRPHFISFVSANGPEEGAGGDPCRLLFLNPPNQCYRQKMKLNLKKDTGAFKFVYEMLTQIMFKGTKIVTLLKYFIIRRSQNKHIVLGNSQISINGGVS